MPDLSYFSFEELWSPFFFFGVALAAIGYLYWTGPWRENHLPGEPPVGASRRTLALSGFALFYLAQGGPLELLGHLNFMFHMINMSLSYLIVPPLVLLGTPAFIWRSLFGAAFWRKFRWLTSPILSLLLFNGLFSFYHVPAVHDYIMTNYVIHALYYAILLIAAFLMWWHVVGPVPEWNRLSELRKMGYIFANGLLLTPACALIIFAGEPLYRVYTDPAIWADALGYCIGGNAAAVLELAGGPSAFTVLGPFEDQQTGGIIMKLVQEVMYGSILAYVFYQWFRKERDAEENPPAARAAGNPGNHA
ncbi:MAG: cytochrome c oxidase assembly factor CtaG [Thermobacillus sp. ZCTH02-B1]|nr:cytochrome c oxidase assembly factor CtaG [Thermobacillus sp. ZCTH02-B1]OUM94694.1 MAG: cytochrome c oxidase assembly factor CtaG [Thermobacillus sp. ZCTH02-B1]